MSQHGVQAVTSDGKLDIDTDEWRDTLNWYRDLVVTEKVASPLPAAGSQAAATNQFLAGNAAMNIDGPWSLINAKATASFEVGIAPMPVGGSGSKTVSAGSGFGVSAKAANQDLAAKACAGLVNVDSETYLGQSGRAFPARTAQQSAWYEGNGLQDAQEVMDAMIAAAEGYRTTAKWTQVNNEWNKYAVPCFNGDTDVDSFIQQVQAQA
jgi:multiple sugar transport system substrate-binding protein